MIKRLLNFVLALIIIFSAGCSGGSEDHVADGGVIIGNPDVERSANIIGFIQKGPFIRGSSVTIQEMDKTTLSPTGSSFDTSTRDDFGSFSINCELVSPMVEVIANGYYFDEITGHLSSSVLTLRTLADLDESQNVHINILTTLERERIMHLVMEEGKSFSDARTIAEAEILRVFHIPEDIITQVVNFDQMDISKEGESNAILLAISAILQDSVGVAELSELISKISQDLETDGRLDNDQYVDKIENSSANLDLRAVRTNLENRYASLGLTVTIPNFEDYVDSDGDGVINGYDYILLDPKEAINDTKPHMDWTDSKLPEARYHLQVATDQQFSNIVEDADDLLSSDYIMTQTLSNNEIYYWRVLAKNKDGFEDNRAGYGRFSVSLGAIELLSPNTSISYSKPHLDWQDSLLKNVSYHMQVASSQNFQNVIEEAVGLSLSEYTISDVALENGNTYYWRVAAIDGNGVYSDWSDTISFSIDLGTVLPISPLGTTSNSEPSLFWNASPLADATYHLQVASDSGFGNILVESSDLTVFTYSISTLTLQNLATYWWRVAVIDENGVHGSWSTPRNFTVNLGTVSLQSPSGTITNTKPELDWSNSPLPQATYNVQLASDSGFNNILDSDSGLSVSSSPISNITLQNLTTYWWRVAVIDENGVQGSWATPRSFIVNLGTVTLQSPSGMITNTKPILEWSDSQLPGVTYHVQISSDSDFSDILEEEYGLVESSYTLSDIVFENFNKYYWRVSIVDQNSIEGTWSETLTFTFLIGIVDTIKINKDRIVLSPDDNSIYALFSQNYQSMISIIKTSAFSVVDTFQIKSTSDFIFSPDGLRYYTRYYTFQSDSVVAFQTVDNSEVASIGLDDEDSSVESMMVSPDGKFIYVIIVDNFDYGTIAVVNTTTNKLITKIYIGDAPSWRAVISQDGKYIYAIGDNSPWQTDIAVVDTLKNLRTAIIPLDDNDAYRIVISPDGEFLYVTNFDENSLSIISTATNNIVETVEVGSGPADIVVTKDGKFIYINNVYGNSISILQAPEHVISDTITYLGCTTYMVLSPSGDYLYVLNSAKLGESSNLSIIQTSDNTLIGSFPIGITSGPILTSKNGKYIYVCTSDGFVVIAGDQY